LRLRRELSRLTQRLIAPLALAAALLCARATTAEEFAPPGRMFPVYDTHLHLDCVGSGRPAVVMEAGLGGNYLDWNKVQPELARTLTACSYDRAGAGFSERTLRPRTLANIGDELHELVRAGGIPRPFVLMGHSFGGMIAMDYAHRFPQDVVGLVLLDSMHPNQFARFADAGVILETDPRRVLGHTPPDAATYGMPAALRARALSLATSDGARIFIVREMWLMPTNAAFLNTEGLPRLPARVMVHGNGEWSHVPPEGRMEAVWRDLQDDLARRLGAPPPIVVAESGHQIALDAPDAVTATVRDLIATLP
jgi:pimeloyl-ACP methyl ester carboxylesterase